MRLAAGLLFCAAALAAAPAAAHHGWRGQDNAKVTVVEGPIRAVRYRNPHGEVEISQGNQRWLVTLAPLSRMQARGVTEETLKVGQVVRVSGHRNLDQRRLEMKANDITMGGKTTSLR